MVDSVLVRCCAIHAAHFLGDLLSNIHHETGECHDSKIPREHENPFDKRTSAMVNYFPDPALS